MSATEPAATEPAAGPVGAVVTDAPVPPAQPVHLDQPAQPAEVARQVSATPAELPPPAASMRAAEQRSATASRIRLRATTPSPRDRS